MQGTTKYNCFIEFQIWCWLNEKLLSVDRSNKTFWVVGYNYWIKGVNYSGEEMFPAYVPVIQFSIDQRCVRYNNLRKYFSLEHVWSSAEAVKQ